MRRFKRFCVALFAMICLFSLLPAARTADASSYVAIEYTDPLVSGWFPNLMRSARRSKNKQLIAQIEKTYTAAKKRARRRSFKGRCGAYVNHQLVVLGINTKYIAANGNREFDVYRKMKTSSGGYSILAFTAKKYTLKSALRAIEAQDPNARNILIGFEKGTSKAGRRYGHTLFIHGIEDGMVYFSDSYAQKVDGKKYKEGEAIVCSIDTFAALYKKYRLDGVIWFR